ncbi:Mn2+ and Fe2+ transporter of the NRAMP family (plasmid) [Halalkaliarchaeum sp. AArc-CO]|uniref:Nramp family divalent metal transporter n=1 Tax=Halalkaliarchaeum sp. AArc-CO TaxID=2866381 RepID=UPI00217DFD7A|nr:Nramp family divalent metal transporter [Halalkaliarchaeum sp. AArc-CO]UWG49303.1 Mn2+ and Fe2+ transporter of the NRAMP family [Halalkaliarchaeum sp. AArc-CO]
MGSEAMTDSNKSGNRITNYLRAIGPALFLAAVVVGPGSIALSTIAGGLYGYSLVWVPIITTIFMITYVWMAARIALVTGETIFGATRKKYSQNIAFLGGFFGFLTILAFQVGNNAGIGFASEALVGGDVRLWAAVFTLVAIGFVWLPDLYDKIEWLVRIVVGIMLIAFVGTLALVGVDLNAAAVGLVPSFPTFDAVTLSLGMAATTFSIAAAVYISHLMAEKEWGPERLTQQSADTIIGIAVLGLIATIILLTSAAVIFEGAGEPVFSAHGMALQLEPLVGPGAFYLFTIGFFFAALSSLVVNALIGATLFVDGRDMDPSMDERPVKMWASAAMLVGLLPVLVFQENPIEILRLAQALAIVAFPLLAFLVLAIYTDEDMMGEYVSGPVIKGLGIIGYFTVIGIILNYFYEVWQFLT